MGILLEKCGGYMYLGPFRKALTSLWAPSKTPFTMQSSAAMAFIHLQWMGNFHCLAGPVVRPRNSAVPLIQRHMH